MWTFFLTDKQRHSAAAALRSWEWAWAGAGDSGRGRGWGGIGGVCPCSRTSQRRSPALRCAHPPPARAAPSLPPGRTHTPRGAGEAPTQPHWHPPVAPPPPATRAESRIGMMLPSPPHPPTHAHAPLLDTRRRRRAVDPCGLRAPSCVGAPCVISICTTLLQWRADERVPDRAPLEALLLALA
jgi:hypothetical protein